MISRKYLFITSNLDAQESVTAFTQRLLKEQQQVAVLGPPALQIDPAVQTFTRITQTQEFEPDVVIPMDARSVQGVQGVFAGTKSRFLNKDPLSYQVANCRSFGLSLLAKAGMPVIPYHVLNNPGDILRFEAKRAENPDVQWDLYPDHPDMLRSDYQGTLGLPRLEGEIVQVAYLVSGRHLVQPAFIYYPMTGLLAKGGIPDYRGAVVIPSWNNKLAFIGSKVQAAMSAIGASGFVFVSLLFPPKKRGKCSVTRLSLAPPRGFLSALFFSDCLNYRLADALYQVAGLKEFYLPVEMLKPVFSFLVTDQFGGDNWPGDPRFVRQVNDPPMPSYEQGLFVTDSTDIPEILWESRPTAEIKLDGETSLAYARGRMEWFKLLPDLPVEVTVGTKTLEPDDEEIVIHEPVEDYPEDNPMGLDLGRMIEEVVSG